MSFAGAAGEGASGSQTMGCTTVAPMSSSIEKDRAGPPFQGELTADQWGAVPPIPRAAGSRSIADFSVTPSRGRGAHDVANVARNGAIGKEMLQAVGCPLSRDPP